MNSVPSEIRTKEDNFLSKVVQDAINKASKQLGSANNVENSKGETPKQDYIRNKLKRNCTSTNEHANYKNNDQEGMRMRLKQNWQSAAVETKSPSLNQDEVQEKHELSPSSVSINTSCFLPCYQSVLSITLCTFVCTKLIYLIKLLLLGWWNLFWKITRITSSENKSYAKSWSSCPFWVTIQLKGCIILVTEMLVTASQNDAF